MDEACAKQCVERTRINGILENDLRKAYLEAMALYRGKVRGAARSVSREISTRPVLNSRADKSAAR